MLLHSQVQNDVTCHCVHVIFDPFVVSCRPSLKRTILHCYVGLLLFSLSFFKCGFHGRTTRGSGGQPPPRAWKISGQELVAQKSWMLKKYLNIVKNSRATLFFRAGPGCSKILHNKKYIFCTMNSGHPMLFRAIANCSKLLNVKSIFNTVKNFRGKFVFRANASC